MTFTSPSGRKYNWTKDEPPTDSDLQAMKEADDALGPLAPATPPESAESPYTLDNLKRGLGRLVNDPRGVESLPGRAVDNAKDFAQQQGPLVARTGLPVAAAFTGPLALYAVPAAAMAGEALAQKMEGGDMRPGAIVGSGIANAVMPGVGGMALNAARFAAGNAAGIAAERVIDEGSMPSLVDTAGAVGAGVIGGGAAKALKNPAIKDTVRDSVRNQNIRAFIAEGGKVPPSMVDASGGNKVLDFVANRANIARDAAAANDAVTVKLAKRSIGIPESEDITEVTLEAAKDRVRQAYYKPVEAVAPAELTAYQEAGKSYADAAAAKKQTRTAAARIERDAAKANLSDASAKLESVIGGPGMARVREGDTAYAKIMDVERAANTKSGSIDPTNLRRVDDKTGKLTGDLETIANFNGAVGPSISKEATRIQAPFISRLFTGLGATTGYAAGGVPGAVAGVMAPDLLETGARNFQLSRAVQSRLAQPKVTAGYQPDSIMAEVIARQATMQAVKDLERDRKAKNK